MIMNKQICDPTPEESPRHRKKSQTASRSNSEKRSDHKHDYEKIVFDGFLGYRWGKRCRICGRISDCYSHFSAMNRQDFLKDGDRQAGITYRAVLTPEEIRAKYPGIKIYKKDISTGEYILIE